MATKAAVATGVIGQVVGATLDLTVSGFGTPTAAIIFTGNANTTNNPQAGARFGVGFWTGSSSVSTAVDAIDAASGGQTSRYLKSSRVISLCASISGGTPGSSTLECTAASITDGIRLTITSETTGVDRYVSAILIAGTTNVAIGSINLGTGTSAIDVTAPGFKPSMVFMFSANAGSAGDGTVTPIAAISFGVAHNSSADVVSQACFSYASVDEVATTQVNAYVGSGKIASQSASDAVQWTAALSAFDSSGFSITPSANTSSDYVYYMALQLADADDGYVGIIDSSTSTGNSATTGIGFTPDILGLFHTRTSAVNTLDTVGEFGLGASDGTTEACVWYCDEDGVTTSNTESGYDTKVLNQRFVDGTADCAATVSSFDADGWTLNYSDAASAARKLIAFAIGDSTASGALPTLTSITLSNITTSGYRATVAGS